jgi:hypothetical protein
VSRVVAVPWWSHTRQHQTTVFTDMIGLMIHFRWLFLVVAAVFLVVS